VSRQGAAACQLDLKHATRLGSASGLDLAQNINEANHIGVLEHALHALTVEIGKGCFIEESGIHDAASGEVINNQVQEFVLVGGKLSLHEEFGKCLLRRFAIQPN
jgi:hypothetical protein